jgi:hypothetical protein
MPEIAVLDLDIANRAPWSLPPVLTIIIPTLTRKAWRRSSR